MEDRYKPTIFRQVKKFDKQIPIEFDIFCNVFSLRPEIVYNDISKFRYKSILDIHQNGNSENFKL